MRPTVVAVIPARLQSTRFPGKALFKIQGQPLLYHVWKSVTRCRTVDRVVIASDNSEILTVAASFGAETFRSSSKPKTGSDRVAELARIIRADIYVNVQGDCFGIRPSAIDKVIAFVEANKNVLIGTLASPITCDDDLFSPNLVKVICDKTGRALWFSRFPIPYVQNASSDSPRWEQGRFLGHIGVYVFRREALAQFTAWRQTPGELSESLEQLRILENGANIHICRTPHKPVSIDSPLDAKKIELRYKKAG